MGPSAFDGIASINVTWKDSVETLARIGMKSPVRLAVALGLCRTCNV
ncbi:MAG: hypothetical protein ABIT07_02770 [Ferruginibacter sp.]